MIEGVIEVIEDVIKGKRLHDDVLHISKKPLRGELSGFLSICQAEASCISPKNFTIIVVAGCFSPSSGIVNALECMTYFSHETLTTGIVLSGKI